MAVFFVFAASTFLIYRQLDNSKTEEFQAIFDRETVSIVENIRANEQLFSAIQPLAQNMLDTSGDFINQKTWHAFAVSLGITPSVHASTTAVYYPMVSLSYAARVPKADLAAYVKKVRADKSKPDQPLDNYSVFPAADKDYFYPIQYIEPLDSTSTLALGYDVSSGEFGQGTIDEAIDAGIPVLTPVYKVPFLGTNGVAGVIPIYKFGTASKTPEERRENFLGAVIAVYESDQLFNHLLILPNRRFFVEAEIFQGETTSTAAVVYDSDESRAKLAGYAARFEKYVSYPFGNRMWTLYFRTTPAFDEAMNARIAPQIALGSGVLTTILLTFLVYYLVEGRNRAKKIAEEMTASYKHASGYNRTLIEASLDPLVTIGENGKITDVNEATIRATGIIREKLIGTDFSGYFTEPEKARAGYTEVFNKGFVKDYPLTLKHTSGKLTDVLYNASLYHDENGKVIGVFAAARDITELKKAESEREQFFKFFNLSNDIMVIADPLGNFKSVNPACTKILGYTDKELISKPFIDFVHPDDKQLTRDEMARQMKIGSSLDFENRYICKDGSVRWFSWRANFDKKEGITYATARDITERKIAEQKMSQLAAIVSSSDDAIIGKTLDGIITSWNNGAERMYGYSEKEVLGKPDSMLGPKELEPEFIEILRKVKEGGVAHYETVRQKKDGTRIQASLTVSPVCDAAGKIVAASTIARDITDRKKAETTLKERTEELQRLNRALMTISEANQISIKAVNEDKLLREVCEILVKNAGYRMVWVGYAENDKEKTVRPVAWAGHTDGYIEKLNVTWADTERGRGPTGTAIREKRIVVDPDFSKDLNFKPWLKDALERGYAGSAVIPLLSDGHVFGAISIYSSSVDLFNSEEVKMLEELAGDLAFSILSIRNKIEKEKADLIIRKTTEELQQFRLAVDSASDHIIITDPTGAIIYANKGAEHVTGYSHDEIIGKNPRLWGAQMPKEFYAKMWQTLAKEKKPFAAEFHNRRKSGELYDSATSITPVLDDAGNIIYYVGVERDVTKEKEIERSKSEFVSLASHQLRTPLSAINWYSEMLLGGDAGKLLAKQEEYTKEIYASSKRMSDLVGALLNVSRIELGTFAVEPKPTDVAAMADTCIQELEGKIAAKRQFIEKKYEKDIPTMNVDPNLTRIIFQNLIFNAVKYTPDGGKITIELKRGENDLKIVISDTGYGIPAHQKGKIFTKFFRADNIIPIETDGTGLGLYIVKEMLDKTGGKISFESEENQGSVFTVSIPLTGMAKKEGSRSLN